MIEKFLNSHRYSANTRDRYTRALKLFLADFPDCGRDLTAARLLDWLDRPEWGANHQSVMMYAVKGFLAHHFGRSHPALELKIKRAPSAPRKALKQEELSTLLSSFDTSSPKGVRDLAICGVFLDCALRVAEVARLELDYVDVRGRMLSVVVKGGRWDYRAFSDYTALWLADWLSVRSGLARSGEKKVFVAIGGKFPGRGLTREGMKMVVKGWKLSTGIEKLHAHRFRHSFATLTTKNGAPAKIAMKGGGWLSEKVFGNYLQGLDLDDVRPYLPVGRLMEL